MRYLVYILVVLNLVFFAWFQYQPKDKPGEIVPAPLPAGINRLVMLSERPAVPAQQPAMDETGDTPAEPVGTADPVATQAMATETLAPSQQVEETEEMTPQQEMDTQAIPARVEPQRACWSVGPLRAKDDIDSIAEQLTRHGYRSELRGDKVREPAGYWVYMPAMPARDARRIVADLDQRGMKDYYIGRKNHISLGIFSSKAKARRRQQKVKALGYDAVLDQRYRNRAVFWLDIQGLEEQPLPASELWTQVQAQHAGIQAQRADCEAFAQQ